MLEIFARSYILSTATTREYRGAACSNKFSLDQMVKFRKFDLELVARRIFSPFGYGKISRILDFLNEQFYSRALMAVKIVLVRFSRLFDDNRI